MGHESPTLRGDVLLIKKTRQRQQQKHFYMGGGFAQKKTTQAVSSPTKIERKMVHLGVGYLLVAGEQNPKLSNT